MKQALKNIAKGFLECTVIPISNYLSRRIPATTVLRELERRAAVESADYVQEKMPRALQFNRKRDLWDHAIGKIGTGGMIAEFGVWNGYSINYFAKRLGPSIVFGFDSFEGLQEDWVGSDLIRGTFNLRGREPKVLPNVRLVKGWFDKTLPAFLSENKLPFSIIHIDCDTYEGTKAVLDLIGRRVQVGTVFVFDEYLGYRGWRVGEFKAWQEFVRAHNIAYEYLAFTLQSVSLRITSV